MPNYETLTYSDSLKGWTSFHSYEPYWMTSMNNDFYTFKNGKVWKHHTNQTRNNYYGVNNSSVIQTVLNEAPSQPKVFKTIKLKGTSGEAWAAVVSSDIGSGTLPADAYQKKEGNWYSYIRRNTGDIDPTYLSIQGVGKYSSSILGTGFITLVFNGNLLSYINQKATTYNNGDLLYKYDASTGNKVLIGQVDFLVYDNVTDLTVLTYVASGATLLLPLNTEFIFSAKNSQTESYGLRGVYMDVTLTNDETSYIELFSVESELSQSYQ